MKRLHIHVAVDDLERAIAFYTAVFAAAPAVAKPDYAKWMLDDPRVNFAISARGMPPDAGHRGIKHLGIQVESAAELADVYGRLANAAGPVEEEGETTCCYARSEKSWITDPAGLRWEIFRTLGASAVYGGADIRPAGEPGADVAATSCCA